MSIKFLSEVSGIVVIPGVDTSCWLWIEGVYEPFQYGEVEEGVPTECDTPELWEVSSVYFNNDEMTPFDFNTVNDIAFFERETLDDARETFANLKNKDFRRALSSDF